MAKTKSVKTLFKEAQSKLTSKESKSKTTKKRKTAKEQYAEVIESLKEPEVRNISEERLIEELFPEGYFENDSNVEEISDKPRKRNGL